MTKQFSFKQLFSLTDGRLSTEIDDVYEMLNHVYNENFMTHHLPTAMKHLEMKNPQWFADQKAKLEEIKAQVGTDEFPVLMEHIEKNHNPMIDVPQFTESELEGFGDFMVENSLLRGKTVIPVTIN